MKKWLVKKLIKLTLGQLKNVILADDYCREFRDVYKEDDTLYNCVYAVVKKTPTTKDDEVMSVTDSFMDETDKAVQIIMAVAREKPLHEVLAQLEFIKFPAKVAEYTPQKNLGRLIRYFLD